MLVEEEIHWCKYPEQKWLYTRDMNAKYFDCVIAIRRRRNMNDMIKDEEGN